MTEHGTVSSHAATDAGEPNLVVTRRNVWIWALLAFVAQIVFVLGWIIANFWQGGAYSALAHSISDMYAVTAPGGLFLVVILTLCGAVTIGFAFFAVWPSLRPVGWAAVVGVILLALSIFGLGDLLTPFERLACRIADPGCSAAAQVANAGGTLDSTLSTIGTMLFVAAAFFLASAMQRTAGWEHWAWPGRSAAILVAVFLLGDGIFGAVGLGGLFERLFALTGAAAIAALAVGIMHRNRV